MTAKYEIGQRFILKEDFTFRNNNSEIVDVPKGNGFVINDTLDNCNGNCDNCKEPECTISFIVQFDGFDVAVEARLTEREIDEIVS